jgi:hypothetical protein
MNKSTTIKIISSGTNIFSGFTQTNDLAAARPHKRKQK